MPTNTDNDEISRFQFIEVDDEPKTPAAPKTVGFTLPPVAQTAAAPAPVVAPTPTPIAAPTSATARQERLASFLASRGIDIMQSLAQLREQRLAIQSTIDMLADRMRLHTTPERVETLADLQTLLRRVDAHVAVVTAPRDVVAPTPAPSPAQVAVELPGVSATPAVPTRTEARAMPVYQAPALTPRNHVATEALVVVREDDKGEAGRIVTWTGHAIAAEKLDAAWSAEELGDARPQPASAVTAFSRAVKALQDKQILVRAAGEQQEGYCIVEERKTVTTERLKHRVICRFWLNASGIQLESVEGNQDEVEHYRRQVAAAYDHAPSVVDTSDVTSWLVREVRRLGGWAIRESGGIYFVPQSATQRVERIKRALKSCGVILRAIPAMRNTDAVLLALDSLAERTTRQLGKLRDEANSEEQSKRVVANRLEALDAMDAFAKEQEQNLGLKLDAMRAEIAAVRKLWAAHATRGAMLEIG